MLNEILGPVQETPLFVKVGVTVIIPEMGLVVGLVAVKFKSPLPEAARPIAVFVFVQS